jgi:hypothetical protein
MRETKITNTELNWLYSALPGSQSTPLTYDQPMVLWATSDSGDRVVTSPCWLSL